MTVLAWAPQQVHGVYKMELTPVERGGGGLKYCTKFGQLILRKVIKIVASKCHILEFVNSISAGARPR